MPKSIYRKCGLIEGCVYPTNKNGDLLVVKVHNALEVEVEFIDTGYTTTARAIHIRSGRVKDKLFASVAGVGCVGVGPYVTRADGKLTVAYETWRNMLKRCYNPSAHNYPRYGAKGVYVCDEWHNYQIFATWYYDNYPTDGQVYQLDKDGLHTGDGPKCYSPSTVQFITQAENLALSKR